MDVALFIRIHSMMLRRVSHVSSLSKMWSISALPWRSKLKWLELTYFFLHIFHIRSMASPKLRNWTLLRPTVFLWWRRSSWTCRGPMRMKQSTSYIHCELNNHYWSKRNIHVHLRLCGIVPTLMSFAVPCSSGTLGVWCLPVVTCGHVSTSPARVMFTPCSASSATEDCWMYALISFSQ